MVRARQLGALRPSLATCPVQWSEVVGLFDGIGTGGIIVADDPGYFIKSATITLKGDSLAGKI